MTDPADIKFWDDVTDPASMVGDPDTVEQATLDTISLLVPRLPLSGSLLDVGAGIGRLAYPLAEQNRRLVIHAYEPSVTMREAGRRPHKGVWWDAVWPAGPFDGAYTVTVLQHLRYDQQTEILGNVSDRLRPGAPLIFQSVLGVADGPGSHHVNEPMVAGWCTDIGLEVVESIVGVVHFSWLWTVAVKR